ncbi:hypothetical protein SAMN03097699_3026 [Flavobacteriaceae bacterium MAR_2010_188]|nr:hypothetical protein SAMN03097699_3026 [Flavobacteriaceae bacterium MAR_2010_188]
MTNSAILLLVFNRPDTVLQVIDSVRLAEPKRLYVAADGPREGNLEDQALCKKTRENVLDNIDWDCEVKTLFRDKNVGLRNGVTGALDWFFKHEESGIILEDDCVPNSSFYTLCDDLLPRYLEDTRIGMISGNNYGFDLYDPTLSYSFSKHGLIWGWATWRRAWKLYDKTNFNLSDKELELIGENVSKNTNYRNLWMEEAKYALSGKISVWASLWGIVRYTNNLLIVRPRVNLVANVGFGDNATHTSGQADEKFKVSHQLKIPFVHPAHILPDYQADATLENFRLEAFPKTQIKVTKSKFKKMKTKLHYAYLSLFKGKSN